MFYRFCVQEQLIDHSPAVHIRRPKLSYESNPVGLDRNELGALLVRLQSGSLTPNPRTASLMMTRRGVTRSATRCR